MVDDEVREPIAVDVGHVHQMKRALTGREKPDGRGRPECADRVEKAGRGGNVAGTARDRYRGVGPDSIEINEVAQHVEGHWIMKAIAVEIPENAGSARQVVMIQ